MSRDLCQPIRILVPDQLQPLPRQPRLGPRGLAELPRASQHLQGSVVTNQGPNSPIGYLNLVIFLDLNKEYSMYSMGLVCLV